MMQTEFEKKYYVERRGSSCAKWDGLEGKFGDSDLIAMWVADMDFRCPDSVIEAMKKAVENGAFGYYNVPDSYYDAFIRWEKEHHGYEVKREWLRYTPGVVAGIYALVNAYSQPGDACIILSPCYYPFMGAIQDNGRRLCCSQLVEKEGRYTIDFENFEKTIADNQVKVFILCSPHNPVGRVWTREELVRLMEICRRHHVFVICDEIHQDIVMPGYQKVTLATLGDYDDMMATLTAPSKTFNLAGGQNSFAILPDPTVREKFEAVCRTMRIFDGGSFGYIAAEAAYTGGEEWLKGALETIWRNFTYLRDTLAARLPKAVVTPLEGTYLSWVDLSAYTDAAHLKELVQDKARLAVDFGCWFFDEESGKDDCHIRVNLATSGDYVEQAVENLIAACGC